MSRRSIVIRALLSLLAVAWAQSSPARAQSFIEGIDVSLFQDAVNWATVRAEGIEFAYVRSSRGETYNDPLFLANMRGATQAGVLVGPYHYCNLDTNFGALTNADAVADATAEANHFLSVITPYYAAGQFLPPVADVEGFPTFPGGTAQAKTYTSAWVTQFSNTIHSALGVRPIIYGSLSKVNSYYTPAVASQHDLWLAWWKGTGTTQPPTAGDTPLWGAWNFWQWTDAWTVNGITGAVDGDVFNGNRTQLEGFLRGGGALGELPKGRLVLTDYDGDNEGYFGFAPTYSGTTTGVASVTADRVTSQAHEGAASQQYVVSPNAANWTVRMVSGIGAPPFTPANPTTNLPLESTGSIGIWLKTTSAGVTVQLLIDDPVSGNTAIETSTVTSVTADGQWQLYQWEFDNAAHWNNFAGGGDGTITGSTVTIDSIVFKGNAASTFYLDTVAHNPNGSLTPIAADFNGDLLVDGADLASWQAAYGANAGGDADGDGDSDGADFLTWQRQVTAVAAAPAAAAVPEPAALLLATLALACGWCARRAAR